VADLGQDRNEHAEKRNRRDGDHDRAEVEHGVGNALALGDRDAGRNAGQDRDADGDADDGDMLERALADRGQVMHDERQRFHRASWAWLVQDEQYVTRQSAASLVLKCGSAPIRTLAYRTRSNRTHERRRQSAGDRRRLPH